MEGVRLASLFSYTPNKLKYCGPDEASSIIYDSITNNRNQEQVKELLLKFEALYPYLKTISEKNSKDIFDYGVVEAYWIGNELANLEKQYAKKVIGMLRERGLLDSIANRLTEKIENINQDKIPLTHLFNVLFVGVGAVTGSVPTIVENMDKCRVSWGTVSEIHESHLIVEYNRLKKDDKYFISKDVEKIKVIYDKKFFDKLNIGDIIAVHWRMAIKKLNPEELNNLKNYTQKTIELISKL
ncbi:MAG: DUF6390 family protein [Nanoarchaeota archaeon]|nr:DUF6390 family protein [Nanoarchaeota archaeon]